MNLSVGAWTTEDESKRTPEKSNAIAIQKLSMIADPSAHFVNALSGTGKGRRQSLFLAWPGPGKLASLKFVLRNREILCVLNAQGNAYI
jgi:hypothetical protein